MSVTSKQYKEQLKGAEFESRIFRVPVENLGKLEKKIARLNRKAAKLGTAPCSIDLGELKSEVVKPAGRDQLPAQYGQFQYLTVKGEVPIIDSGWSFIGTLEPHESGKGTIVNEVPGTKIPKRYFDSNPHTCEHCNKTRKRKETFVVKKGRKYVQVGRSCLKDFLGHAHPENYADYAQYLATGLETDMEELESFGGGGFVPTFKVSEILAVSHAEVKANGYVKSSYYGDGPMPTSAIIANHFNPPKGKWEDYRIAYDESDEAVVPGIVEYIKEMYSKDPHNSYWHNLALYVETDTANYKSFGFLASAVASWLGAEQKKVTRKQLAEGISNDPIAGVDTKVKVVAEIIAAHTYRRQTYHYYDSGVSQVLTMKTNEGQLIKMFSSNMDLEKGDSVIISGTIKSHEEETYEKSPFKGKMVTMFKPRARIKKVSE